MRFSRITKILTPVLVIAILVPIATPQIGQLIKLVGIWEVTKRYGGEVNSAFNKLVKRDPEASKMTKVVQIITEINCTTDHPRKLSGSYSLPSQFTHGMRLFFVPGREQSLLPDVQWQLERILTAFFSC